MENAEIRPKNQTERTSIMQAYNRLESKLGELSGVAAMTTTLYDKLNRAGKPPEIDDSKKEKEDKLSIPELLNAIADEMEFQIKVIAANTEQSIHMIE